jgi:hypothetical protein
MKGLIIEEPWISKILDGSKTWEMRTRATTHRGWVALIRKGSGMIVGIARLTNCTGPLSTSQIAENAARHRVPIGEFTSGRAAKWNVAWHLESARPLSRPVAYRHPAGAVVWVRLENAASAAVALQADLRRG